MFKNYVIKKFDFITVGLVLLISIIGVVAVGSASGTTIEEFHFETSSFVTRQLIGLLSGIGLMVTFSLFDYHWLGKMSVAVFALSIIMLLAVRVAGESANNATRWILVGNYRLQPSEFTKIFLIITLSSYYYYFRNHKNNVLVIIGAFLICMSNVVLIYLQPDLSTSMIVLMLFVFITFVSGISYWYIVAIIGISIPLGMMLFNYILKPTQKLLDPYQVDRIVSLMSPEKVDSALLYQTNYSIQAIGSGQVLGKGLFLGKVNMYKYLPEPQTDFIFSVIAEELGFLGALLVLGLLLFLIVRIIYIGLHSMDIMGKLLVTGIATMIAFQTFVNVGVATGILPNTGVTLPFVSYGVSSLWTNLIAIGIALNVSMQPKKKQSELNVSGVNKLRKETIK